MSSFFRRYALKLVMMSLITKEKKMKKTEIVGLVLLLCGLALMFFSLQGCAGEMRGVTRHGTYWTAPPNDVLTNKKIEAVIDITAAVFERETGLEVPEEVLSQMKKIEFVRFSLHCSAPSGKCKGVTYSDRMFVKLNKRCVAFTSLSHEYIHVIINRLGMNDRNHKDPRFFILASGKNSIEYKAMQAASVVCD